MSPDHKEVWPLANSVAQYQFCSIPILVQINVCVRGGYSVCLFLFSTSSLLFSSFQHPISITSPRPWLMQAWKGMSVYVELLMTLEKHPVSKHKWTWCSPKKYHKSSNNGQGCYFLQAGCTRGRYSRGALVRGRLLLFSVSMLYSPVLWFAANLPSKLLLICIHKEVLRQRRGLLFEGGHYEREASIFFSLHQRGAVIRGRLSYEGGPLFEDLW